MLFSLTPSNSAASGTVKTSLAGCNCPTLFQSALWPPDQSDVIRAGMPVIHCMRLTVHV